MNRFTTFCKAFKHDEDGGISAEYAFLAILIAVVIVIAVAALGLKTLSSFCLLIEKMGGNCS